MTAGTNTAATTSSDGSFTINVASSSTLGGTTNGEITLSFSCNSQTHVKKYSWSKAIAGTNGGAGTSATSIVCGNESISIPCTAGGLVSADQTITIPFAGYLGTTRKACSVTYSTLPSGMTLVSNTAATTSADGSLVLKASKNGTLGSASTLAGDITLTFSCNSQSFVKKLSWSKSMTGAQGPVGATGATGEQGIQGPVGATGPQGKSLTGITEYYARNNTTTAPSDSAFGTSVLTPTSSEKYVWNYELLSWNDNGTTSTTKTAKHIIAVYGDKGNTGKALVGVTEYYARNNSTTAPSDSAFGTSVLAPTSSEKYVWNYELLSWNDNGTTSTTKTDKHIAATYGEQGPVGATGATGEQGPQGPIGATGSTGAAGGRWYAGTAITGTSTTATIFSGSGITNAVVGDMYLNTSTYNTYRCTVAGAASVAKWVYVNNIKGGKGDTGSTAQWYYGTALTHTSGTATLATSQTSGVVVGAMYLNPDTSLCYKCTAISGTTATWTYAGDLTTGVLENIEIGGRNLLADTNVLGSKWTKDQATVSGGIATITVASSGDKRIYQMPANSYFTPEANTEYTLSVEAKSSNGANLLLAPNWANVNSKTVTVTSNWAKYTYTFTTASSVGTSSTTIGTTSTTGAVLMLRNPKLERGNKATDWTPAPEDICEVEYIVGTQTGTTNVWTGVTKDASLSTGKTIAYYLPYAGNSSAATLNLTLAGGGTTGAKNVRWNNTNITTHYPQYSIIQMTYDGTYWRTSAYNSDTFGTYGSTSLTAGTNGIYPYTLIMRDGADTWSSLVTSSNAGTGTSHTKNSAGFYFDKILQNANNTTYASGSKTGRCDAAKSIDLRYSTNCGSTLVTGKPVYLVGTVTNGLFYLDNTWWTQTEPSTEDNKYYIYLGMASSTTSIYLVETHTVWVFKGGFKQLSEAELTDISSTLTKTEAILSETKNLVQGINDGYVRWDSTNNRMVQVTNPDGSQDIINDFLTGWMQFGLENNKATLTIGDDSGMTVNVQPDKLSFCEKGVEVAYISNNQLWITQSVVLQQMDVGNKVIHGGLGQWSWKIHPINNKNNLYLKWLG